jgi:hypothetical protein
VDETVDVRLARIDERMRAIAAALELQAREYERRLVDLNHAHEKQVSDQSTYVSDDAFQGFVKEIRAWQRSVDAQFAELKGGTTGVTKTRTAAHQSWVLVLMSLGVGVAIALAIWN